MSKRAHRDGFDGSQQPAKRRKGFSVGPANLPDGTYRRKTQRIKDDLIEKAKVKKEYAKIKARQEQADDRSYNPYGAGEAVENELVEQKTSKADGDDEIFKNLDLHPDRQAMLEESELEPAPATIRERRSQQKGQLRNRTNREGDAGGLSQEREKHRRPSRYAREFAEADVKRLQFEARQKARDARERERKAMAKARRPGKDGKMKLGRQGTVLLSRVKRLQEEGKL